MYEAHWNLERRPFEQSGDQQFYYPSESHQGALLKLRYAVENRRGAALLCGPSGGGKTLLVQLLRRQLPANCQPLVHLVFPQMPAAELLNFLADELGAAGDAAVARAASERANIESGVRRIQTRLVQNAANGQHAVVAVDEAHLIDDQRTLHALRMLLNFEADGQPCLTLLLVGQPGLLPLVDRMPSIEERLGVKCLLRSFTLEETVSYVNHRLTMAGAKSPIFEPGALDVLHELTRGSARRINRLCDLALLVGFAEDRRTVGAEQLEAVSQELVSVAPE